MRRPIAPPLVPLLLAALLGPGLLAACAPGAATAAEVDRVRQQLDSLRQEVETLREENHHLREQLAQQQRVTEALLTRVPPDVELTLTAHIAGFEGADGARNPTLEVRQGDLVRLVLANGEEQEHDLVIDGVAHSPHLAGAGDRATVVFLAAEAGRFTYYCSVPGHRPWGLRPYPVVLLRSAPGGRGTPFGRGGA